MTAPSGATAYLGSVMSQLHFWGLIGDWQAPPMIGCSFELSGTDGAIILDAIQGEQGPPGQAADIVKMQYEDNFTDPSQLPTNLLNNDLDIGRAWWIGNIIYMWSGTSWVTKQMGVPGPPGPVPNIAFAGQLVPSGIPGTSLVQPIEVQMFGTALNPTVLIKFDHDSIQGPQGDAGLIMEAADYDGTTYPVDGQTLTWRAQERKWGPGEMDALVPQFYSMPEANFNSVHGLGTSQLIGSFQVPPQPFAWKPMVFGHIKGTGIDLTANPLIVGCEVTLGDPVSGQLVGRGFGNSSTYANIVPHFSRPTDKSTAVTPANGVALVPAYHTGTQGTLYVSAWNDGATGSWSFQSKDAQLTIMVVPVSQFTPVPGDYVRFSGSGVLSMLVSPVSGS